MAEYTAVAVQTVGANQNVLFTETPVCGGTSIVHREGSGLITARGIVKNTGGCNCDRKARYKVTFGANIAIPTGGTAGPISMAVALNGEAILSTQRTVTPAAAAEFFSIATSTFVEVPAGDSTQISVKNTAGTNVDVQNANIIVERVA